MMTKRAPPAYALAKSTLGWYDEMSKPLTVDARASSSTGEATAALTRLERTMLDVFILMVSCHYAVVYGANYHVFIPIERGGPATSLLITLTQAKAFATLCKAQSFP